MSRVLAFIPARAGSKGIIGKNKRLLCGKPLFEWSLEAALGAREVNEVCLSSDDKDILARPLVDRLCVSARPPRLATDEARIEDAILAHLEARTDVCDTIVLLQPTSPLRTSEDIDRALWHFRETGADSLFSAVATHEPFYWRRDPLLRWVKPYESRPDRQWREAWLENGSIYIFKTEGFLKAHDRLFGKIVTYGMGPEHRYEIDDETDWQVVEALMNARIVKETPAWQ